MSTGRIRSPNSIHRDGTLRFVRSRRGSTDVRPGRISTLGSFRKASTWMDLVHKVVTARKRKEGN